MPLTTGDILKKTFKRSLIGYNEDEVDRFLDQIIKQVEGLQVEEKEPQAAVANVFVGKENSGVSLTIEDILKKTFQRSFKGYNEDEVDRFLDEVIALVKALQTRIEILQTKIETLQAGRANK